MLQPSIYLLTGFVTVVVLLTRWRLGARAPAITVHTVAGLVGLVGWVAYLAVPGLPHRLLIGIVGLGLLWVAAYLGLFLLTRWRPARGRHASARPREAWTGSPLIAGIAHLGVAVAVALFTWGYLVAAV